MRRRRGRLGALGASTKQASLFRPASLLLLFVLAQIRLIGEQDAVLQAGTGLPAEFGKSADVEQFARGTVRPRGVKGDRADVTDRCRHHAGEFGDGEVSVSMRATLRVILRVTKVSPRIGLS